MDIQDTRRAVLRELIKRRNGGVVRQFAADIGKPDGQINDMLATPPRKSFGERVARAIEAAIDIEPGYLDNAKHIGDVEHAAPTAQEPKAATYAANRLSADAYAVGRFYELLPPMQRATLRAEIVKRVLEERIANPEKFSNDFCEIIDFLALK